MSGFVAYREMKILTELYCPNCGKRDVWVEDGDGDYYAGPDYGCKACNHCFNMPYGPSIDESFPARWEVST